MNISVREYITVVGAREHNLKNIDVTIPKNSLVVITGPSGSGKSTLALDVLYTEGKRRYMESLSSYTRQFLGVPTKPDVDAIYGLCPAIAIEQKTVGSNPRSTVGTITEIYDYLRVLFARIGLAHCPVCGVAVKAESVDSIVRVIMQQYAGLTITLTAPLAVMKKGEFVHDILKVFEQGFYRIRIDGVSYKFESAEQIKELKLSKQLRHSIDLLIDAVDVVPEHGARITEAVEVAFDKGHGVCKVIVGDQEHLFSSSHTCLTCARSIPELEPRLFSFNSPIGACVQCNGLGAVAFDSWSAMQQDTNLEKSLFDTLVVCERCGGDRLNEYARVVTVAGVTIGALSDYSIKELEHFFTTIVLDDVSREIASSLLQEIMKRLQFLTNVGLGYLTLARSAATLSGGEGQRIRLATQIGSALSGVLYVLDEPSIGLHQRDNEKLIQTLLALKDAGNTVVVVEHDLDTILKADYVIDMGPGAGVQGGAVTASGTPEELQRNPQSLTGGYLSGRLSIPMPSEYRAPSGWIQLMNATSHNLKNITVDFPLHVLCAITGVSGSGKSSLIMYELVPALKKTLGGFVRIARGHVQHNLIGADTIESLVIIDQSPIGRMPRSNPATYLGIFDHIRKLYASLPESNARGYKEGRFSFNVSSGWCAVCKGDGMVTVEMHFLPPVHMVCKECKGKRYNKQTLEIRYKGKNIADVLAMTVFEALDFFSVHGPIAKRLALMCDVGLDYLALGQPSTTLSGGEAQRIKLVDELAKRGRNTVYILDEPTTGLHMHDIVKLLLVLNKLVEKGNTVYVIEHNIDLLRTVDYIIDLGPDGGVDGGDLIAVGTPLDVARCAKSYTGHYLKMVK